MPILHKINKTVSIFIEDIKSFFEVKGVHNKSEFVSDCVYMYALFLLSTIFNSKLSSYLIGLIIFAVMTISIQKRCRDFGYKGTACIILFFLASILICSTYFIENTQLYYVLIMKRLSVLIYIILSFLFIIPSKVEPDMALCSPLLKYPLVYIVVCWILIIAATFAVNQYAGRV